MMVTSERVLCLETEKNTFLHVDSSFNSNLIQIKTFGYVLKQL